MTGDLAAGIARLEGPVLVLGAGGFVGARLVHHLAAARTDVVAAAHSPHPARLADVTCEVVPVDVTSAAQVEALVARVRPRTVLDCTAYGGYAHQGDHERIYDVNFRGVVHVVEALAQGGFAAYVHAGTSSEYGLRSAGPSETDALAPNSHYAVSKAAAADYLTFAGTVRGLPVVNLRLYSVYGPGEEPGRLVPSVLRAAAHGERPQLSSPDPVRDYVHVDDVCDAFVRAALHLGPEVRGTSLNIGTGVQSSVADVCAAARQALGERALEPVYGAAPGRPWEVAAWYADPARARDAIGWTATTTLADGLRRTFDEDAVRLAAPVPVPAPRRPSVSAVIACYNEGPAVPVMHQRLTDVFRSMGCDYEIIFVNNGSTDGTAETLEKISRDDPHVIGINHSRSFGSQMAFTSGMELSTMDSVVILDGDLQDPPELIPAMYEQLLAGHDVVYGRRVRREMSRWAEAPYRLFYRIFQASSEIVIPRDAGDFSLISRRAVDWLLTAQERDLFLRGLRAYIGFSQTGVDYVRPDRMFGTSTNNWGKNIGWAKKAIFAYSRKPLDLLTNAGFVLLGLSVVVILLQIVLRLALPETAPRGFSTILLSVVFFGSMIMVGIGILGEYIGKILEEVKQRPRYIRESVVRDGVARPEPEIPHRR